MATSIAVKRALFSFATNRSFPSGLRLNCSGSGPDGISPISFRVFVSMIAIVSSSPRQTNISAPSLLSAMPRGLWPVLTVRVTSSLSTSMTEIELPFSLVM